MEIHLHRFPGKKSRPHISVGCLLGLFGGDSHGYRGTDGGFARAASKPCRIASFQSLGHNARATPLLLGAHGSAQKVVLWTASGLLQVAHWGPPQRRERSPHDSTPAAAAPAIGRLLRPTSDSNIPRLYSPLVPLLDLGAEGSPGHEGKCHESSSRNCTAAPGKLVELRTAFGFVGTANAASSSAKSELPPKVLLLWPPVALGALEASPVLAEAAPGPEASVDHGAKRRPVAHAAPTFPKWQPESL
mmetsp:Transcript_70191/g.142049  ORF Transcript_70191/g.142049 Transcript_70191/m.142049 type:complete len:246 (-) Transcript_70191:405-1142(-)